jgi:general secretion pathway protein D
MENPMQSMRLAWVAGGLLALSGGALGQTSQPQAGESASTERPENGVPLARLIAGVARKTGKKFIVDPRVHGDAVLLGEEPGNVTYGELLSILRLDGFTAVESGGYVQVIPEAGVRALPLVQVSGKETRPDEEFVSTIIAVRSIPATQLVPLLRPLIPQAGHLVALPCVNKLILVDTFANIRRLEALIQALDGGEPYKPEKCETREAAAPVSMPR